MQRLFFSIILLLGFCVTLGAQSGNTLLMGSIKNPQRDYLEVYIDKSFVDNTQIEELCAINKEGKFGLGLQLELPQLLTIRYNNKEIQIFLEPADTLIIEIDGLQFPYNARFSGRSARNNECLRQYRENFPEDRDQFHYRQYLRGLYYYKVHEEADKIMRATAPVEYLADLRREQLKKEDFLQQFGAGLSSAFKSYLSGDMEYQALYRQLAYGHIYKGLHRLDSSYFQFADSLHFDDAALGNEQYREFLLAYINYRCEGKSLPDSLKTEYAKQYYYAKKQLQGLSRYWAMARIVAIAFRKEDPKNVLPIYEDFLQDNPFIEFDRLVVDAFQRTRQFAAGSPAPTFSLQDANGNYVSLRDFQGKVIYLDFWASWCRPCMKKMRAMQSLQEALSAKGIVFLHVNLDPSKEQWQKTLQENQFGGVHLYNTSASSITRDYEVLSVPKFFVITKEGNFAYMPSSNDETVLAEALLKLTR